MNTHAHPIPARSKPANASHLKAARPELVEGQSGTTHAWMTLLACLLLSCLFAPAQAQDILIKNATVHTASSQGTLNAHDVLIRDGRIAKIGAGLSSNDATVIDANGKPLTPALFAGINKIGLEEVSAVSGTVDGALGNSEHHTAGMRPEFNVAHAYNPDSVLVPITRVEGYGWSLLTASPNASIIGGQGGAMRLDGSIDLASEPVLFISMGASASSLTGNSRAAQFMHLEQAIEEAKDKKSESDVLTKQGEKVLRHYVSGDGLILFQVHRAVDIRRLLHFAKKHRLRIGIVGADEGWKVADELAAANVTVFIDPFRNLPSSFDSIAASELNATKLHEAGVRLAFTQYGDASHNARKMRQLAGNAVANGLPWDVALAAISSSPAKALGMADDMGSIAVGQRADVVLWTADPLDVNSVAERVILGGRTIPMTSRQTELRDRYLKPKGALPRAYQ